MGSEASICLLDPVGLSAAIESLTPCRDAQQYAAAVSNAAAPRKRWSHLSTRPVLHGIGPRQRAPDFPRMFSRPGRMVWIEGLDACHLATPWGIMVGEGVISAQC